MRAMLFIVAGLLAGCATTAPPTRAPVPMAAAFTAPAGSLDPERWWQARLADPSLAALVEAGLKDAPNLAAAMARVEAARARLGGARAAQRPDLSLTGNATRSRTAPAILGIDPVPPGFLRDRSTFTTDISASFDPDVFGRLRATRRAETLRLDAADADVQAVRLTLVTDIARNWVAVRGANAQLAVARDTLAAARELETLTGIRARAGLVPGLDAVRAASLAHEAEAALQPLLEARATSLAVLTTLTGLSQERAAALVGDGPLPDFGPMPAAAVPATLLSNRPDVIAAARRLAAADADTAAQIAARWPVFNLTAAVGAASLAFGDLFTSAASTASLGAGLTAPLIDFGRNKARVAERRALAAEAFANYRTAVLAAVADVETNLAAATGRARQQTAILAQQSADNDAVAIATIQYRRGLADLLVVLDATRTGNRSRNQAVAAHAARLDAELALFRAIGVDSKPTKSPTDETARSSAQSR
jgi:NodT family efflux transporter outer membrane factor (OMF) lipoprotein